MVRDISEDGMRIQMAKLPPLHSRVEVEMRGLTPRFASVLWVTDREAGLAFDEPCDLAGIFQARLDRSLRPARPPRFDLLHSVDLSIGGRRVSVEIVNISVGGARIVTSHALAVGSHGVIALNLGLAFDSISGEICWAGSGVYGFHFTRPMSSLALALALEAWEA